MQGNGVRHPRPTAGRGARRPGPAQAPKHRALLAVLLLAHREDAVSPARLVDAIWDEDPPATAAKVLQVYVSQLRRALGAGHPIVTRPAGYERRRTLRVAIGWSYDLLDEPAQRLFAGGFTLEAAEEACGIDALDGIAALADQSLVTRQDGRFGMLETVREYALERLESGRGSRFARRAPARALAKPPAGAEAGIQGPDAPQWLARLDAERDNVRAALEHAVADCDLETALPVSRRVRDPLQLSSTLRAPARVSLDAGGDPQAAQALRHESLAMVRDLDNRRGIAEVLETRAAVAEPVHGARLLGAVEAVRAPIGAIRQPDEDARVSRTTEQIQGILDPASFRQARAAGRALDLEAAIQAGLEPRDPTAG
jgi:hypothetical protein